MSNNICLRCNQRPKRDGHWFCSDRCTQIAAANAPVLIRVPKGHVLYDDVKRSFKRKWESHRKLPTVSAVFLITMTKQLRQSFETYRDKVRKARGSKYWEVKRFRAEYRVCRLGEGSATRPCTKSTCSLCQAIKSGFKTTLSRRRTAARSGGRGVRFGGGVYMAPSSSKAYEYANETAGSHSKFRAVLSVRSVLGKVQYLNREEHRRLKPDKGYDSVEAQVGTKPKEIIVYDSDAVRPAFLIMCK